jgi:hypothetical protein
MEMSMFSRFPIITVGAVVVAAACTRAQERLTPEAFAYSADEVREQISGASEKRATRRVVTAPAGAIITTLPGGCATTVMGNVSVQQCGPTYYRRVSSGYQVVVL